MISYSEAIKQKSTEGANTKYVLSGIKEFDNLFNGFPIGVNLVAARPGMGLTSLCSQILSNSVTLNNSALYLSLDLTALQLAQRINLKDSSHHQLFIGDSGHVDHPIPVYVDQSF